MLAQLSIARCDGDGEGGEGALVLAMRSGRAGSGAAFYDRYARAVHGLVFRLMGPDPDVDDVVHDTFVRAFESLPTLRDPSALRSWVMGIAARTVLIRFQARRRQRWLCFMPPEAVPSPSSAEPDPALAQALADARALLDAMDAGERAALLLHRVEGLSLEAGARAAKTSLSTFRRRLARGETKLRARAMRCPALAEWMDRERRG